MDSIDVTPSSNFPSVKIPTVQKLVRIILVDARAGATSRRVEMCGQMEIPLNVYLGQVYSSWRFDELCVPVRGVVTDLQPEGCTFVFPFIEEQDALSTADGKPVSLDDLRGIFLKYHPTFKVTLDK